MCDETVFLDRIEGCLCENGREVQHFKCHDFFSDRRSAKLAAHALQRHLLKSGGRLGGFHVKMSDTKRQRHGILWRATKVNPVKSIIIKKSKC